MRVSPSSHLYVEDSYPSPTHMGTAPVDNLPHSNFVGIEDIMVCGFARGEKLSLHKIFMYSYGTFFAEKHVMSRQPKRKKENSTQFPVKLLVLVES